MDLEEKKRETDERYTRRVKLRKKMEQRSGKKLSKGDEGSGLGRREKRPHLEEVQKSVMCYRGA
jgi:hypothetical protein